MRGLSKQLPATYSKAYRWDGEMREIAKFLEPERGAVEMLTGAADLYIHVAADYREGPKLRSSQLSTGLLAR